MTKARNVADLGSNDVLETTSTGIDVTGTATMDGLTVGDSATSNVIGSVVSANNTSAGLDLLGDLSGTKGVRIKYEGNGNLFSVSSNNADTLTERLRISDGGDISFYEDTGTTAKFFWDASAESLGIGTSSPSSKLDVAGDITLTDNTSAINFNSTPLGTNGYRIYANISDSVDGGIAIQDNASNYLMTVRSSGNVGIGTSSPSENLHIVDSAFATLQIESTSASSDPELLLTNDNGGASEWSLRLDKSKSDRFQIRYNNASKMILDTSGNLLVGKTSSGLGIRGVELRSGTSYFTNLNASPLAINREGNDGQLIGFYNDEVGVGAINCSGSTTSYNTSSDYRLKEDWQPVANASDRVAQLKPVNFAWKADGKRVDGFLAHELQEVIPEAVTGTKDAMRTEEYEVFPAVLDDEGNVVTEAVMGTREVPDYQGIDQSKLVPLLTAALQEALTRIETLEAKVAVLENN